MDKKELYSFVATRTSQCRILVAGDVMLDKYYYSEVTRISPEALRALMQRNGQLMGEAGSVLYGREAVEAGLCDRLGSLKEALACLHTMIREGGRA